MLCRACSPKRAAPTRAWSPQKGLAVCRLVQGPKGAKGAKAPSLPSSGHDTPNLVEALKHLSSRGCSAVKCCSAKGDAGCHSMEIFL